MVSRNTKIYEIGLNTYTPTSSSSFSLPAPSFSIPSSSPNFIAETGSGIPVPADIFDDVDVFDEMLMHEFENEQNVDGGNHVTGVGTPVQEEIDLFPSLYFPL